MSDIRPDHADDVGTETELEPDGDDELGTFGDEDAGAEEDEAG
jgi:hypothetical protein